MRIPFCGALIMFFLLLGSLSTSLWLMLYTVLTIHERSQYIKGIVPARLNISFWDISLWNYG